MHRKFSAILQRGITFVNSRLLSSEDEAQKGATQKGKNLLLDEQILSFMSCPPFQRGDKMN